MSGTIDWGETRPWVWSVIPRTSATPLDALFLIWDDEHLTLQ